MSTNNQTATILDLDAFERANSSITTLKARLPEDAVVALAREVVTRLASRVIELDAHRLNEPSDQDIDALCIALVSDDLEAGAKFIARVRNEGASVEMVYLSYLAAAARRLGAWWDEDRVSFVAVTIAASRIYAIMRGLRGVLAQPPVDLRRAAVFASVPGETHTLGVSMAADLFRSKGWDITLKIGMTHEALLEYFTHSNCTVIGLSASGDHAVLPLARLVVALRISNPQALIMLSGKIVQADPETVAHLGVDSVAQDVPGAIAEMERLLVQVRSAARH